MEDFIVKSALLSSYRKDDILTNFARGLADLGVELFASGGTASYLAEKGLPVVELSSLTGFASLLGGRVKTLHPVVYAGILSAGEDRTKTDPTFDLVAVDLYPFEAGLSANKNADELIELIDIGGISLLRAAAKNFRYVLSLADRNDWMSVIAELKDNHTRAPLWLATKMAKKAFLTTSHYDAIIAESFFEDSLFAPRRALPLKLISTLRYGENPHQKAALYANPLDEPVWQRAEKLWGKELSYNNYLDMDSALLGAVQFGAPACAIVKHLTPCGIAVGHDALDAYVKALASDSLSAFGGIVAVNRPVDARLAEKLNEHFLEVIIAPSFDDDAMPVLQKKKMRRLVRLPMPWKLPHISYRGIMGGMLVQELDSPSTPFEMKVVSERASSEAEMQELGFAWLAVRTVESNSVVIAKNQATVGIGGGATSRVDAAIMAVRKAMDRAKGAVAATDGFLPFPDTLQVLADAGVVALIQPGGSKRDNLSIEMANRLGVSLVMTGVRHFRH